MHRSGVFVALAIVTFTIGSRLYVGPHVVDDAYITFRVSRNLVQGNGFTYNPPARIQVTSAPLFAGVLALGAASGLAPERVAPAISILADVVTVSLVVLMFSVAGLAAAGWCAAALIAISPFFVTYSVSGLETSAYVALLLSAAFTSGRGRDGVATGFAATATVLRPDGAVMLLCVGIQAARRGARSAVWSVLIALAILLPWATFSLLYFGAVVPQSVVAKQASASVWVSLQSLRALFLRGPYALITPLAIAGLIVWSCRHRDPAMRIWFGWTALYLLAFVAAGALTHYPWYLVPVLPAVFAGFAISLVAGLDAVGGRRGILHLSLVAAILVGGGLRLPAHKAFLANLRNQRERLYLELGRRLSLYDSRCVVAATEIGAVGYAYPGPILDLVGLASPEAVGQPAARTLENGRAAWLVSYDSHLDESVRESPWFQHEFRAVWAQPVARNRTLFLFKRVTPIACGGPRIE